MAQYKFPCLDCPDRKPACHSNCTRGYREAKAKHDEMAQKIKMAKAVENDVYEYNKARAIAAKKKMGIKDVK